MAGKKLKEYILVKCYWENCEKDITCKTVVIRGNQHKIVYSCDDHLPVWAQPRSEAANPNWRDHVSRAD